MDGGTINSTNATLAIDTISGGIINGNVGGTSNVTATNQITGGSSSNLLWKAVPTNTSETRHLHQFGANSTAEATTTGTTTIYFDNDSVGSIEFTRGPATGTATIDPGTGLTVTIAADNGTNNTDNIVLTELPFSVVVVSPGNDSDLRLKLANGTITTDLTLDEAVVTRGDVIEYAYRAVGASGFAMKYGSFTVPNLPKDGTQTFTVVATLQPYPRSQENPQTQQPTATVGTFANSIFPMVLTYAVQNGPYMNKILCEAVGASDETFTALFGLQDDTWFGSDGSLTWFNANTDYYQVSSTTAVSAVTEETMPYFRPTNSSAVDNITVRSAQFKISPFQWLGQSYDISPVTPAAVADEIIARMAPTINGIAIGLPDAALLIPIDDITPIDL